MISSLQDVPRAFGTRIGSAGRHLVDLACLTVLAALVIFPGLGQLRACISHEVLHAETIREMAEHEDYVETKILGERIPDKPPVMHAPAALLTHWVGQPSMFLARLPSAMAGILGILATYGIGLALMGRRAALIGAVGLLGIPGYSLLARQAIPDMMFCAAIVFSCLGLVFSMRSARSSTRVLCLLGAGFAAGIATLTKGPLGLLFPVFFVILAPFGRTDLRRPRLGGWLLFLAALLVAAGIWAVPAYMRDNGVYLREVVFQRDLNLGADVTPKPFYKLIGVAILFSLPLSVFLPMAIRDIRRHASWPLLAVAAAILLTFVCVPKKRDHYLLPMYPFLALGIAASVTRRFDTNRLVKRTVWTLLPVSLLAYPVFFTVIQPRVLPHEDPEIRFAREALPIIGPDARVYCVSVHDEVLAWIDRRDEGITRVRLESAPTIEKLRQAPNGAYLLINGNRLDELVQATGPLPLVEVLRRPVRKNVWILYRLAKGS